ncbi:MAG: DNA repair protein RadC [Acidobacteria bacterium]|nr:DNA repair protein RadC [Acidobacteriota bacterium]
MARHPGTIAALAPQDRPREKLERSGAHSLGDNELLAVLLGHGGRGADALAIANTILSLAAGSAGLTRMHRDQLASLPGVGPAQASRIAAAIELGRRTLSGPRRARPQFRHPRDLAAFLLPLYGAHPVERFGVLLLDARYRLLSTQLISVGSLDASVAHPREVFRGAIVAGAVSVVAFHNHPSGDPTPSRDDVLLTERLQRAGALIGIDLLDHLILTDAEYRSFKELKVL